MEALIRTKTKARLRTLAASAALGLIVALSQGLSCPAHAEEATADYVAPLDMTSSYPGPFEYPEFLPEALMRRAMAVPAAETTGMNRKELAHMNAPALQQAPENAAGISDDKYNR